MNARCVWAVEVVDKTDAKALPSMLQLLPTAWRRYAQEQKLPLAVMQRAIVAQLLIQVLRRWGLTADSRGVEHRENGAPFLPDYPSLALSISHCHGAVAVAIAEGVRVGIDVESERKVSPLLAKRTLSEAERHVLAESTDFNHDFLSLWTRKEAILKCRGTGIKGFDSLVNAEKDFAGKLITLDALPNGVVGHLAVDPPTVECQNIA